MDSFATSVRSGFFRHYGFTTGQVAVMGKEAGPFFTYGPDGGDATLREQHQDRYENEYLNMSLAYEDRLVEPLEPEELRPRLVADLPPLYHAYETYWQHLVGELTRVREECPTLFCRVASWRPARLDPAPLKSDVYSRSLPMQRAASCQQGVRL